MGQKFEQNTIIESLANQTKLRYSKVYELSRKLVSFIGVHCVFEFYQNQIPEEIQETLTDDHKNESIESTSATPQLKGFMVAFYNFEEADLIDICQEITAIQDFIKLSPEQKALLIAQNPNHLALYQKELQYKKFEVFNNIELLIPSDTIKKENNNYPWITQKSSAYLRNHMSAQKMTMTAYNQGEGEDTLAQITQINTQNLETVLQNKLYDFCHNYFAFNHTLSAKEQEQIQYLLDFTIVLINQKKGFDLITLFISTALYHYFCPNFYLNLAEFNTENFLNFVDLAKSNEHNDSLLLPLNTWSSAKENSTISDASMLQCLGRALPILQIPCDTFIFTACDNATKRRGSSFSKIFAKECLVRERLSQKQNLKDEAIDIEQLKQRYQKLIQLGYITTINPLNNTKIKTIFKLSELEQVIVSNFLSQFNTTEFAQAYRLLCLIEWQNKLSIIFQQEQKNDKAPLSIRTCELINNYRLNNPQARSANLLTSNESELQIESSQEQDQYNENLKNSQHNTSFDDDLAEPFIFLGDDEKDTINLIDERPMTLSDEQQEEVYQFYLNNINAFGESKEKDEWLKFIFSKKYYETDFFLAFALALTPLYVHNKEISSINLTLINPKQHKDIFEHSTFRACGLFATLYGPLLKNLKQNYPTQFFINYKFIPKANEPCLLSDFESFRSFYHEQKFRNLNRNKTFLDFQLEVCFSDKSPSYKVSLRWIGLNKAIGPSIRNDLYNMCSLAFQSNPLSITKIRHGSLEKLLDLKSDLFGELPQKNQLILKNNFIANFISTDSLFNGVNLTDINTFLKDEHHVAGTFTPKSQSARESSEFNLSMEFHQVLSQSNSSKAVQEKIAKDFANFEQYYLRVLITWYVGRYQKELIDKCVLYYAILQNSILSCSMSSEHKKHLLDLVHRIGLAQEIRQEALQVFAFNTSYIATPFHIESIKHQAKRIAQLEDMVSHILQNDTILINPDTINTALYKSFLTASSSACIVAKIDNAYALFSAVQSFNGYVLYEPFRLNEQGIALAYATNNNDDFSCQHNHNYNLLQFAFNYKHRTGIDNEENKDILLNSFIDLVADYLKRNPQFADEFNLVIYNCIYFNLAQAILKKLSEHAQISNGSRKINLFFVNDNVKDTALLFKNFEYLSFQRYQQHDSSVSLINTYVLSLKEFSKLQEIVSTTDFSTDENSLYYLHGDLGILFHSFDALANLSFKKEAIFLEHSNSFVSILQENSSRYCFGEDFNARMLLSHKHFDLSDAVFSETLYYLKDETIDEHSHQHLSDLLLLRQSNPAQYQEQFAEGIKLNIAIPQLILDMGKHQVGSLLEASHDKCNVVLCIDALLGKRQMQYKNIKIVHYQQNAKLNANILLSTKRESGFFQQVIEHHLLRYCSKEKFTQAIAHDFSATIINEAINLSGGILMREENENIVCEIFGLVFAKYIVDYFYHHRSKLPLSKSYLSEQNSEIQSHEQSITQCIKTYVFLDDYQSLFGLKQQQRADILAIALVQESGQELPTLELTVIEAKYHQNIISKTVNSAKIQVNATLNRFINALYGNNNANVLDKQIFLSHFADMLLDTSSDLKHNIDEKTLLMLSNLRSGKVNISICGVVFAFEYSNQVLVQEQQLYEGSVIFETSSVEDASRKASLACCISKPVILAKIFNYFVEAIIKKTSNKKEQIKDQQVASNNFNSMLYHFDVEFNEAFLSFFNFLDQAQVIDFVEEQKQIAICDQTRQQNKELNKELAQPAPPAKNSTEQQDSTKASPNNMMKTHQPLEKAEANSKNPALTQISKQIEKPNKVKVSLNTNDANSQASLDFQATESSLNKDALIRSVLAYCFPQSMIFIQNKQNDENELINKERKAWGNKTIQSFEKALMDLNFKAQLTQVKYTSSGLALYYKGDLNFVPSKILARIESFKSAYDVDVIYATAGKGHVIINIAEPAENKIINYCDLWRNRKFDFEHLKNFNISELSNMLEEIQTSEHPQIKAWQYLQQLGVHNNVLIGLDETLGETAYINFFTNSNPHILIGGQSGGGKSVFIQNILIELILLNTANNVQILIIDPKNGAEFGALASLPHLKRFGIVHQYQEVEQHLLQVLKIMDERYNILKQHAFKNLDEYNEAVSLNQQLPRIVICFDEVSDFLDQCDDSNRFNMKRAIQRLVQKSRATGIYLILSSQRPSQEVITPQSRTNCGNRFAFKTIEKGTSDIILGKDNKLSATRLSGKGHLAAQIEDNNFLIQSAYLNNRDAKHLLTSLTHDYQTLNNALKQNKKLAQLISINS